MADGAADFPASFSQFSLSVWCCEFVNIRGPNGIGTPYGFDLRFDPSQAHVEFRNAANELLFVATFNNPNAPRNLYHVMLSVDTMAQTYSFWVSGVQWPTTDAVFLRTGAIYNGAG